MHQVGKQNYLLLRCTVNNTLKFTPQYFNFYPYIYIYLRWSTNTNQFTTYIFCQVLQFDKHTPYYYCKLTVSRRVNMLAFYFTFLWYFVLAVRCWWSLDRNIYLCLNEGKKIRACVPRIKDFCFSKCSINTMGENLVIPLRCSNQLSSKKTE